MMGMMVCLFKNNDRRHFFLGVESLICVELLNALRFALGLEKMSGNSNEGLEFGTVLGPVQDLQDLQNRVACFEKAMAFTLKSVNPVDGVTCWTLVNNAVGDGLLGLPLVVGGVSTLGEALVGAMVDVMEHGLAFVEKTIHQGFVTTFKMMEVSCVLRMCLLLVDHGSMMEELPAKPCALCRAFARCLLRMFDVLCCFVDALLVAPTTDTNLESIVKMLVFDTMAVLAWVVEDEDFHGQHESLRSKYKSRLIDVVLRVLNKPGLALATHSTAILAVLQHDFRREHFVLLRKFLDSPAQGQAAQELHQSVADILGAIQ